MVVVNFETEATTLPPGRSYRQLFTLLIPYTTLNTLLGHVREETLELTWEQWAPGHSFLLCLPLTTPAPWAARANAYGSRCAFVIYDESPSSMQGEARVANVLVVDLNPWAAGF